jgi:hypothetical protein
VERSGFEKAIRYLDKCKLANRGLSQTDVQLIDAKVKGLQGMLKNPDQRTAGQEGKREARKAAPGGGTLLDKVSADEAAREGAQPPVESEGAQPPVESAGPGGQAPGNGQAPEGGSPKPQ